MSTSKQNGEKRFAEAFQHFLLEELPDKYVVFVGKSLLYKLEVDVEGNLRPKDLQNPMRGQFAFETDILIKQKSPSIPLVVVELKFGGFSTHDIITYSSKATRHKEIYPYLRYGFVVGKQSSLSKKFLTHNQGIDFAMAFGDLEASRGKLLELIHRQIRNAETLVEMMKTNRTSFTRYEKNIDVAPDPLLVKPAAIPYLQSTTGKNSSKDSGPRFPRITKNAYPRPGLGTKTGMVWDIADTLTANNARRALRREVLAMAHSKDLNLQMASTQYGRWKKSGGHLGRVAAQ